MAKALKYMLVSQLADDLRDSPGLMVIDPGPMTVESAMAFRRDLREKAGGARLRIIHNRTARVAMKSLEYKDEGDALTTMLVGPSAVVFGGDDPVPIAKVVGDWRKKLRKIKVKGAVADGEVLAQADAEALATMPDLPQLRGMLAGAIIASARGIAVSLQSVYGGLARALQARIDAEGGVPEEEAADAPAADAPAEDAAADESPAAESPAAEESTPDASTTSEEGAQS